MHVLLVALLACAGDPTPPAPEPSSAEPVLVVPAEVDDRWAAARCNDGTPFGLTLRDAGSDRWVIKVAGGYFCDDVITPCRGRKGRLTTGPRRPRLEGGGLFSRDRDVNPLFADANQVELHYCSSDLWLGDATERRPTTGDPGGWYFSGRHNLRAGLEVLVRDHGLGDGDEVLLVGYSAGGMGVVSAFDEVRALLGDTALKVLLDGAWVPPQPLDRTPRGDAWGSLHPGCTADREAAGDDPLSCVFGPSWYPYLRDTDVPVLIQQSGRDVTQLRAYGVKGGAAWRDNARESFHDVGWLYSGGGRYHVVSFDERFTLGDPSFRDVLGRFWAGGPPERVLFDYDGGR